MQRMILCVGGGKLKYRGDGTIITATTPTYINIESSKNHFHFLHLDLLESKCGEEDGQLN